MDGASGFFRYFFNKFGKLLILAAVIVIALIIMQHCNFNTNNPSVSPPPPTQQPERPTVPPQKPAPKEDALHKRLGNKKLIYTKHARCRMDCRNISEAEVKYVLKMGKVNAAKSDVSNAPCPKYAFESETASKEKVRIIFADCPDATKVITAIDLKNDNDSNCHCN